MLPAPLIILFSSLAHILLIHYEPLIFYANQLVVVGDDHRDYYNLDNGNYPIQHPLIERIILVYKISLLLFVRYQGCSLCIAVMVLYLISARRKLVNWEGGSSCDIKFYRRISRDYGKDSDPGAEKSNSISARQYLSALSRLARERKRWTWSTKLFCSRCLELLVDPIRVGLIESRWRLRISFCITLANYVHENQISLLIF